MMSLHRVESIMLSDALAQLHVLMLKKRGGREVGAVECGGAG